MLGSVYLDSGRADELARALTAAEVGRQGLSPALPFAASPSRGFGVDVMLAVTDDPLRQAPPLPMRSNSPRNKSAP